MRAVSLFLQISEGSARARERRAAKLRDTRNEDGSLTCRPKMRCKSNLSTVSVLANRSLQRRSQMFVYRLSPFPSPLLSIFSPFRQTESQFTGYDCPHSQSKMKYALASQHMRLADAGRVDNKLSIIETIDKLMMAEALQKCLSRFPKIETLDTEKGEALEGLIPPGT